MTTLYATMSQTMIQAASAAVARSTRVAYSALGSRVVRPMRRHTESMCGVCGVVMTQSRGVEEATLRSMCAAIAHRGPDDEGVFVEGNVGLGIRRLSIIDLAGGHQPISNEDGTVDRRLQRRDLQLRRASCGAASGGHVFSTRSDTEVIVHGYEEFGHDVVHRLRGMFAFALWDARLEELFVAVDRFGIKPLYWTHGPEEPGVRSRSSRACCVQVSVPESSTGSLSPSTSRSDTSLRREASSVVSGSCCLPRS